MGVRSRVVAAAMGAALAGGCAATAPEGALIADPYESFNRDVHDFNVGLDQVLVRPASQAYDFVAPALVQHMLGNFVDHLILPISFINFALQGNVDTALETAGRFGVNTLVGAGGLLDPATEFGLPQQSSDFGLTLAEAGAEEGVYLVLPLFGPSTSRDAVGRVADFGLNPLTYIVVGQGLGAVATAVAENAVPPIVIRHRNKELVDELLYESEDSYVALRNAYVQFRRARVAGGVDVEALPDVFEE